MHTEGYTLSFWRDEVIESALDHETKLHVDEQLAWIRREPENARPYHHLAQLYRMNGKPEEAVALLLHAVHLDPRFAEAHASLTELYAIQGDYRAAWRHARLAGSHGEPRAMELLERHSIAEPEPLPGA